MARPDEPVDLEMTAGLPYNRQWRVTGGKSIWATEDLYEIRSHVRLGKTPTSEKVFDLTPFLKRSYDENDIVVRLEMTGADTRSAAKGNYDIVLSDPGAIDTRGLIISHGKVKLDYTVTAATDD